MTEYHRGDSYSGTITLTDTTDAENPAPLDLAGKRITVTCRTGPASPARPESGLVYQHYIEVDDAGAVTESQGMALQSTAAAGIIVETFASTETAGFTPSKSGKPYYSDLEVRARAIPADIVATPVTASPETVTGDYTLPG